MQQPHAEIQPQIAGHVQRAGEHRRAAPPPDRRADRNDGRDAGKQHRHLGEGDPRAGVGGGQQIGHGAPVDMAGNQAVGRHGGKHQRENQHQESVQIIGQELRQGGARVVHAEHGHDVRHGLHEGGEQIPDAGIEHGHDHRVVHRQHGQKDNQRLPRGPQPLPV